MALKNNPVEKAMQEFIGDVAPEAGIGENETTRVAFSSGVVNGLGFMIERLNYWHAESPLPHNVMRDIKSAGALLMAACSEVGDGTDGIVEGVREDTNKALREIEKDHPVEGAVALSEKNLNP